MAIPRHIRRSTVLPEGGVAHLTQIQRIVQPFQGARHSIVLFGTHSRPSMPPLVILAGQQRQLLPHS